MKKIEQLLEHAKQGEQIEIDQKFQASLKEKIKTSHVTPEKEKKESSYFFKRFSIVFVPVLVSFILFFQFYKQETIAPTSVDLKSEKQEISLPNTELSPADTFSGLQDKEEPVGGINSNIPVLKSDNTTEKAVQDTQPSQEMMLKKAVPEEQNKDSTESTNINQATPFLSSSSFTGSGNNIQKNDNTIESCTSKQISDTGLEYYSIIGSCYWQKNTPLAFLEELKMHPQQSLSILGEAPQGWITQKYVEQLMKFIDSQILAAPVVSVVSSYSCHEVSTVGNEALFLIEGFRQKKYPPTLCSVYGFKPNKEEIKKWWEENK